MSEDDSLEPLLPPLAPIEQLREKLDILSIHVWDSVLSRADIEKWLANFNGAALEVDEERLNALHILGNFCLFGVEEVRELLFSVYRDLYLYPIVQEVRKSTPGHDDLKEIQASVEKVASATRFLGMGNPSESGQHLLYYLRQVTGLPRERFISAQDVLINGCELSVNVRDVTHLVFIDDVLGSGDQAVEYSNSFVKKVKEIAAREGREIHIWYFVIFARAEGLARLRATEFDMVEAVHEIQDSEVSFSENSRVYTDCLPGVSREHGLKLARTYGEKLAPGHGLGYKNGQLLLGFRHNIPDNTLPIIWAKNTTIPWVPAFPRYDKVY